MGLRAKTWIFIVLAAAVIVGIILYVSLMNWPSAPTTPPPSTPPVALGSPVFAPKGELTPGFPKSLILDNAATIDGSYSINYSSSINQYTAEWNSSSSLAALYTAYKQYLPSHGWTIVNDITKYPTSRGLYARNASSDVSVAIIAQGSGSQIILTYLGK